MFTARRYDWTDTLGRVFGGIAHFDAGAPHPTRPRYLNTGAIAWHSGPALACGCWGPSFHTCHMGRGAL